jgi:tetratricopeptide (TPR) repeat protein
MRTTVHGRSEARDARIATPFPAAATLLLGALLALSGCAQMQDLQKGSTGAEPAGQASEAPPPSTETAPTSAEPAAAEPAATESVEPVSGAKSEPVTEPQSEPFADIQAPAQAEPKLSPDNLYKLLVAELAGRRGRLDLSLKNYLEVARETQDPAVAERAVRIAVFARDQENGLEAAKLWTELAPESTAARQVYAALLLRAGQTDDAVTVLAAAVPHFKGGPAEAYPHIGDMLARERDKAAAILVMERLVSSNPDDIYAQSAYAQLLARGGKIDEAVTVYEKVLALDPDDQANLIIYSRLLNRQGKTELALSTLSEALTRHPDADRVRLTYARLLVDAKHYDDALEQFAFLSKSSPENGDVRYAYGLLLLQTNHLADAEAEFRDLITRRERVEAAYYYLGQIAESKQDMEGALKAYRMVDDGEHRLNAQIRVAVLLAEGGQLAEGRAHLHGLRSDNTQQAIRIYRAEAEILAKRNDFRDALQVYDGALEEYPGDTDLLYARAMLAEKMDLIIVLERDLRTILASEPNNADALNALGYTLADRTDRYDEAYELIKRAYELKPNDHYVVDSMGWVLYRMGRHQESLVHLRRAMELNGDPEIAAHLGEVLWMTGNEDAAREIWDTALKDAPDDAKLLDVKKRFER